MNIGSDSELTEGANDVGQLWPALADPDDAVHVLLGVPGLDHFGEDVSGGPVAGHLLLRSSQLLLKLCYPLRLLQLHHSAEFFRLVLPGNLRLLTPTLATCLEEVSTGAFHGCNELKKEVS